MSVRRIFVEKKPDYAVKAGELREELESYLDIKGVKNVRVLIRYDIENLSDETFERACNGVFAEPPVDTLYKETFPMKEDERAFSVEYLPGQFDQRADSAVQCVQFIREDEKPVIKTATTYVIEGSVSDEEFAAIKAHCINPVDSRETGMDKPETLVTQFEEPADVLIFDGFQDMEEGSLKELYDSLGLAMTFKDFLHIQNYFRTEEKRDPSMTEIRVLDTYWSDHCRHTTFQTELTDVTFAEGDYKEEELKAFAGERISQFNQSQGEEPAFENEKGAEKLPVALDTVSMKDGRAVLVTEYDTPSRLVEFSQDIGDEGMPFDSIDIGSPASLALKEQTSYLDIEGKAVDQQEILKETGLAVRVSGQGVISAEKKIRYISEGCTLRDVHTVETASEGVSCIILE